MACFCIVYELRIFFTFLKCLKKQAFATKTVYGPQSLKHILSSLCRKSLWAPWTINKTKPKSNLILLLLFSRSVMADSFETPWTVAYQFPSPHGLTNDCCCLLRAYLPCALRTGLCDVT